MRKATSPNDLLCPRCMDIFDTPRYLPCRHTFCEKCLDDFIQMTVSTDYKEVSFNCPVCGKKTLPPLSAISIDKWARHFPYDRILLALLPDDRKQVELFCNPCRLLGNTVTSTIFCTTCEKTLCFKCRKTHESHSLVETSDNSPKSNINAGSTLGSSCPVHIKRDLEFICMCHDNTCCSDCVIDNHRSCEILRLKDHSEELFQAKKSRDAIEYMKKLIGHLDHYIDRNEKARQEVEMKTKNMVSEIDKLISKLQMTRSRIVKESEDLVDKETLTKSEDKVQCKSLRAAMHNSLKILEILVESGDSSHSLITMYQIEEQLLHYDGAIQSKFSDVKSLDIKLKLDGSLLVLQLLNTNQLAEIEVVETTQKLELPSREKTSSYVRAIAADRAYPHSPSRFGPAVQAISRFFSLPKKDVPALGKKPGAKEKVLVKMTPGERLKQCTGTKPAVKQSEHATVRKATPEVKLIEVQDISDENEHRYWGVVFLPSYRVMLVDRSHNQCRIFDRYTYHHLTDFDLKSEPLSACVLNENQSQSVEVAVAVWNGEIQILSMCSDIKDTSIRRMKTIKTKLEWCHSVATLTSSKLVVSGEDHGKLRLCIVSIGDSKTTDIDTICEYTRHKPYPSFLTVSYDKSRVYISVSGCDAIKGAVYCYRVLDGICIFKYKNFELSSPRGITEDQSGNLCILNERPASIHMVTGSGDPIQVLTTGSLRYPISICFKDMELYVTNDRRSEVVRLSVSY